MKHGISGRRMDPPGRKQGRTLEESQERRARREGYVERAYKITAAMYRMLEAFQGGRCWGCRRATGASKELAVDHNHRTGEVRMLLCSTCNQIVGHFRDNPEALIRLGLAIIDPPSRTAWSKPGMLPGWTSNDDELRDDLAA